MEFVDDNNMVQMKSTNVVSSGGHVDWVRPVFKRPRGVYGVRHFPPGCGPQARLESNLAVSRVSGLSSVRLENGSIVAVGDDPVGVPASRIEANEVLVSVSSDSKLDKVANLVPSKRTLARDDHGGIPATGIVSRDSTVSSELDGQRNVGYPASKMGSHDLRPSQGLDQRDVVEQADDVKHKGGSQALPTDDTNGLTLETRESVGGSQFDDRESWNSAGVSGPLTVLQGDANGLSKDSSNPGIVASRNITSKAKYPPRRKVSGFRHFPPNCGRNAKPLLEEGKENASVLKEVVRREAEEVKDVNMNVEPHKSNFESSVLEQKSITAEMGNESIEKAIRSLDEVGYCFGNVASVGQECEHDSDIRSLHNHMHNFEGNVLEQKSFMVDTKAKESTENTTTSPDEVGPFSRVMARAGQECEIDSGIRPPNNHKRNFEGNVLEQKSVIVDTKVKESTKNTTSPDEVGPYSRDMARAGQECERDRGDKSPCNHLQSELGENSKTVHNSNRKGDLKGHSREKFDVQNNKVASERESPKLLVYKKKARKQEYEGLNGLMSSSDNCPSIKGTMASGSNKLPNDVSEKSNKKKEVIARQRRKSASMGKAKSSTKTARPKSFPVEKIGGPINQEAEFDELNNGAKNDEKCDGSRLVRKRTDLSVNLTPFGPGSSKGSDSARQKVRETLRLFHFICRKLVHEMEAKSKKGRVDCIAAKELRNRGMCLNEGQYIIGAVPGVEVGDEFQFRLELNIIGLHRQTQAGIDFVKQGQGTVAVSVVASGGYDDNLDNSDILEYTGQGGTSTKDKEPEDQKLEKGNLALKNSIAAKNHVRVIRGDTKMSGSTDGRSRVYVYDGLYTVEKYWQEPGPQGKLVFKFRMVRIPGQPELGWKQVKKSKKLKLREGLCVSDVSQGKELIPICAVNTVDDEKPPPFKYITQIVNPNLPTPPNGCNCRNGCSEGGSCSCVAKNGGEIPYNNDGAIVEAKDLVYECGPSCKCPPSCYNRVSQQGIKIQLEVFKTDSRGWGVRSLNSIPSGSFICEYAGELLEDSEAERRANDEYLFDIGGCCDETEGNGSNFTIDAAEFGNVGRFINHSCSPNLYAQNVLYDHGDRRIPHIMLFAAENIPPLRELTYHYNYQIDQVHDSQGNIKMKNCYCGSSDCSGRMY